MISYHQNTKTLNCTKKQNHLLEKHHWNKTKVAQELGIGRTTLWRMLKNLPQIEEADLNSLESPNK